jgi:hypothetical protein
MPCRKLIVKPLMSWRGLSGPSMDALSKVSSGWPAFAGHDKFLFEVRR